MSDDTSTPLSVQQLGIHHQYQPKASKLLFKITEHPDIMKRIDAGKMVVFGKAKPGTNFNNLFKSMVGPSRDLNQPGIDKFLEALRRLGVRSNELSGKELQLKYEPQVPRGSSQFQLAALKTEPSSITKTEISNKYVKPTTSLSTSGKYKVVLTSGSRERVCLSLGIKVAVFHAHSKRAILLRRKYSL